METSQPTDIAKLLGMRFLARRNAYAVQHQNEDGHWGYARKTKDMKLDLLVSHLAGDVSVGHYLINPEAWEQDGVSYLCHTRMFAFDIDPDKGDARDRAMENDPEIWRRMIILAHGLCQLSKRITGSLSIVSYGGAKGLHVLCPLRKKIDPVIAKEMGELILQDTGFHTFKGDNFWKSDVWPDLTVEIFPKQTHVEEGGFGNLMRLPLGVNSKTKREAYFIPQEAEALGHMDDPIATLTSGTIR